MGATRSGAVGTIPTTMTRAAVDEFSRTGYVLTTMDQVAATAGVTKRTLYKHVGSKANLLVEVHRGYYTAILERWSRALDASEPQEALRAIVTSHVELLGAEGTAARTVSESSSYLEEPAAREIRDLYRACTARMDEALRRCAGIDGARTGIDPTIAAHLATGSVLNLHRWYRPDGPLAPNIVAGLQADFLLFGLRLDSDSSARRRAERLRAGTATMPLDPAPAAAILAAATRLFREKGYHGTTTRELAAAAGLTPGALYYYAKSKEDLLFRIHQEPTDLSLDAWARLASDPELDPAAAVRSMVDEYCAIVLGHRDAVAVFSDQMRFLGPDLLEIVGEKRQRYTDVLTGVLARRADTGASGRDPHLAAVMALASLNSVYRWYEPSTMPAKRLIDTVRRSVMSGIVGNSSARS